MQKKLVITSKFIRNKIPPEAKWFLIELLYHSAEYKLDLPTFEKISEKYRNIYKHLDVGSYFVNILYYKTDSEVVFKAQELRFEGIHYVEKKKVKFDIDNDKLLKLMTAYNRARSAFYRKVKGFNITPLIAKPSLIPHYKATIEFLEQHEITDWNVYFYAIFASHGWNRCPSFIGLHSPECLDKYLNYRTTALNEINQEDTQQESNKDVKSIWIDLYNVVEVRKERFVKEGKAVVCMANIDDNLGYHPLSKVCTECPLAAQCKIETQKKFEEITQSKLDLSELRGNMNSVKGA